MFKVGDKVKLEDLPLVEVRNYELGQWFKMYFLGNIEGVKYQFKVLNMKGESNAFKFMRPIQEPEMRPMTHMEIIDALKKEGCALKDEDGLYSYWDSAWEKQDHTITYDGGKTWGKLEVQNENNT